MEQVSCYSGSSYADRPNNFVWENRSLKVIKVLASGNLPAGKFFYIVASDDRNYRLEYNFLSETWQVQPV